MQKLKTRKGARKRFKITARGKVLKRRAGKGHLLSHKNKKRKRFLRRSDLVGGHKIVRAIKMEMPYC